MASSSLMERLKVETADLHRRTESTTFQRMLFAGEVSRSMFVRYLVGLYGMHSALEDHLLRATWRVPEMATILTTAHFHATRLRKDLEFFGVAPRQGREFPSVSDYVARLERESESCPVALLGAHYVFEGSANGGRILAPRVRRALRLTGVEGSESLDPHGEKQREIWLDYRRRVDECAPAVLSAEAVLAMARDTFLAVEALCLDLLPGAIDPVRARANVSVHGMPASH